MARALLAMLALSLSGAANAQEIPFPQRGPIEITVLYPAGSSADVTARMLADGMSKQLAATVIVVNRPGAGGAVGYRHVASQKPDGYNLVWNSNSITTTFHSGMMALDYTAFDAVARVLLETPVLAVKADAPWRNLAEFTAAAKARPKTLTVGNSGQGSHTHISSVALSQMAGIEVVDVPYATAQVISNLVGGHVAAAVQLPGALAAQVRSGGIRLLAALGARRDPTFPEVPTAQEQGVAVALDTYRGIAAPGGTPAAVIARLEDAIRRTVETPEFVRATERFNVSPAFLPSDQFARAIAKEDAVLAALMKGIGLKK